jgi:hypothetical protein
MQTRISSFVKQSSFLEHLLKYRIDGWKLKDVAEKNDLEEAGSFEQARQ